MKSNQEKIEAWRSKKLHARHLWEIEKDYVDKQLSHKGELFFETEGFHIEIQDKVIATRNYVKFILKKTIETDKCRKCGVMTKTIEHITSGCPAVAGTNYLYRHNQVAKIVHIELANK